MRLLRRLGSPGDALSAAESPVLRQAAGRVRRFLPPGDVAPQALVRSVLLPRSSVPQLLQKLEPARLAVPQCGQRTTDME